MVKNPLTNKCMRDFSKRNRTNEWNSIHPVRWGKRKPNVFLSYNCIIYEL